MKSEGACVTLEAKKAKWICCIAICICTYCFFPAMAATFILQFQAQLFPLNNDSQTPLPHFTTLAFTFTNHNPPIPLYLISPPFTFTPSLMKLHPLTFTTMDNPSSSPPLERKPSIDSEPKTLLEHEMKLAREAALKIMNTHTKEEALKIFLAGLVPVTMAPKQAKEEVAASEGDEM